MTCYLAYQSGEVWSAIGSTWQDTPGFPLRARPFTGAGWLVYRLAGTHWVLQRNGVQVRLLAHPFTILSSGDFRDSFAECVSHLTAR